MKDNISLTTTPGIEQFKKQIEEILTEKGIITWKEEEFSERSLPMLIGELECIWDNAEIKVSSDKVNGYTQINVQVVYGIMEASGKNWITDEDTKYIVPIKADVEYDIIVSNKSKILFCKSYSYFDSNDLREFINRVDIESVIDVPEKLSKDQLRLDYKLRKYACDMGLNYSSPFDFYPEGQTEFSFAAEK